MSEAGTGVIGAVRGSVSEMAKAVASAASESAADAADIEAESTLCDAVEKSKGTLKNEATLDASDDADKALNGEVNGLLIPDDDLSPPGEASAAGASFRL
jgi:hypothetical protein